MNPELRDREREVERLSDKVRWDLRVWGWRNRVARNVREIEKHELAIRLLLS